MCVWGGGGGGGNYVYTHLKANPLPQSKLKKFKKPTSAVNNTVNKLILDTGKL